MWLRQSPSASDNAHEQKPVGRATLGRVDVGAASVVGSTVSAAKVGIVGAGCVPGSMCVVALGTGSAVAGPVPMSAGRVAGVDVVVVVVVVVVLVVVVVVVVVVDGSAPRHSLPVGAIGGATVEVTPASAVTATSSGVNAVVVLRSIITEVDVVEDKEVDVVDDVDDAGIVVVTV